MTLAGKIAQGLKWQALAIGGRQVLSLAVFTTLARLLLPSDFGQVALLGVYTVFLSVLTDLGLTTALIQRPTLTREHIDSAFWFLVIFGFLAWFTTVLAAEDVARLLGAATSPAVVFWFSLAMVARSASIVHGALLARDLNFKVPAIRTLIASGLAGAVAIAFAATGFGVWALVAQELVAAIVGTLLLWFSSSYRPRAYFSMSRLKELATTGLPVNLNAILWFFSSKADYYFIGRFLGTHELGLYSVAYKLPDLVRTATHQPLTEVLVPSLARLQSDPERLRGALYKGATLNAVVVFPVFVGLTLVARDLIYVLFGSGWSEAAPATSLLSMYLLISAVQVFFYPALVASGVSRGYIALTCFQSAGTVSLTWIGVRYGSVGVAAALIINATATGLFATVLLNRRVEMSPWNYFSSCIGPAVSALLMCAVVTGAASLVVELPPWGRLSFNIVLGAISYAASMYFFFRGQSRTFTFFVQESLLRRAPTPSVI